MNKNTIEQDVLGCVLLKFELATEMLALVKESDFSSKAHKILYRFIEKLVNEGAVEFNINEVYSKYPNLIPAIGGDVYLMDLLDVLVIPSKYSSNCKALVREAFKEDIMRLSKNSDSLFREEFSKGKEFIFNRISEWQTRLSDID